MPESVIEAFVVKIVVHPDSFDWYLRFNDDPDKPLHCSLEGKRKQTTKIMVSGENSPTMDCSNTGCHQGYVIFRIRPIETAQTHRESGASVSVLGAWGPLRVCLDFRSWTSDRKVKKSCRRFLRHDP